MKEEELVKMLQKCLYSPRKYERVKASVATLKDVINRVSGKHIYCKIETQKSRLKNKQRR